MPPIDPSRLPPQAAPQVQPMPFPGQTSLPPLPPMVTVRRDKQARDAAAEAERLRLAGIHADTAVASSNRAEDEQDYKMKTRDAGGGYDTTEGQDRTRYHARRLLDESGIISDALTNSPEALSPSLTETAASNLGRLPARLVQKMTPGRQSISDSFGGIVDSMIYLTTGAAATQDQTEREMAALQPEYGDDQKTLINKALRLRNSIAAAREWSGPADKRVSHPLSKETASQLAKIDVAKLYGLPEGVLPPMEMTDNIGGAAGTQLEGGAPMAAGSDVKVESRITPEQQAAYQEKVSQIRRGNLTPAVYAAMVNDTYGQGRISQDDPNVIAWVEAYNDPKRSFNWTVPPAMKKLEGAEKATADVLGTPGATGLISGANAALGGIPELLAGTEGRAALDAAQDENFKAGLTGDVVGSLAPLAGMTKIAGAGLKALGPRMLTSTGELVPRAVLGAEALANIAYGGMRGATGAEDGERLSSAGKNAFLGGAGAVGGRAMASGGRGFVSKETQEATERLVNPAPGLGGKIINKMGGQVDDLTTAQRLGFGQGEESFQSIPGPHGVRQRSERAFNINNANRILKPLGAQLPKGTKPGTEANAAANRILDAKYNQILPQVVGGVDTPFINATAALKAQANKPIRKTLQRDIDGVLKPFMVNGQYTGATYKDTITSLRNLAKDWRDAASNGAVTQGSEYRHMASLADSYAIQIRALAGRNTPAIAKELKNIDKAWSQMVRVERATLAAGPEGVYSPGQLYQATKALDSSSRKSGMARGRGLDHEYITSAAKVMGSKKVPETISPFQTALGGAGIAGTVLAPGLAKVITPILVANYGPLVNRITKAIVSGKRPTAIDNQLLRNAIAEATRQTNAEQGDK